jgi:hypothetical protein
MRTIFSVLIVSIVCTTTTFGQASQSPLRMSEAINRAIATVQLTSIQQPQPLPYADAIRLKERGRKEKIVGYHLLVLGAFLMPNAFDFVIGGKYRVGFLGAPLAALGGVIAGMGHGHASVAEDAILRWAFRASTMW